MDSDQKKRTAVKMDISAPPPPHVLFIPPSVWGRSEEAKSVDADHITVKRIMTPDGAVNRYYCQCGGHEEHIVEGRDLVNLEMLKKRGLKAPTEEMGVQFRERTAASLHATIPAFMARHAQCGDPSKMITYAIPRDIMEIVQGVAHDADAKLRAGLPVEAMLIVYETKDHPSQVMTYDEPDDLWASRDATCTMKTWMIREMRRAAKRPLPALVLLVSEVWMAEAKDREDIAHGPAPSKRPDRQEAIVINVLTPEFVAMGTSIITREGGVMGEGPGYTKDLTFKFGGTSSRMTDGLFAQTDVPLSEEAKAWQIVLALNAVAMSPVGPELAADILAKREANRNK